MGRQEAMREVRALRGVRHGGSGIRHLLVYTLNIKYIDVTFENIGRISVGQRS